MNYTNGAQPDDATVARNIEQILDWLRLNEAFECDCPAHMEGHCNVVLGSLIKHFRHEEVKPLPTVADLEF